MKVFVAIFLVISSVAARGSGPYLPSGWKPAGPAFNLPSEVANPAPITAQEHLIEETETSGSDALREYGPPKLVVFVNANQGLPDVATDQTPFLAAKNDEVVADVQDTVNVEANTEQVAAIIEEVSTATESNEAEAFKLVKDEAATLSDVQTTAGSPATDVVDQEEVSADITQPKEANDSEQTVGPTAIILEDSIVATAVTEEVVVPLYKQELQQDAVPTLGSEIVADQEAVPEVNSTPSSEVVTSVSQQQQELTQDAVSTPAEEVVEGRGAVGVNSIAEAIVTLENEVKAAEIQASENAADVTPTQVISGTSEQSPAGFLEYGPPGFLEYGPPKQALEVSASDNNEVRRKRYSPKFSSLKKH